MRTLFILTFVFIPIFLLRYYTSQPNFSLGDSVKITTKISQEPYLNNDQQVLNISGIRVYTPRFPEYHYGDRLEVVGTVAAGATNLYLKDPQIKKLAEQGLLANKSFFKIKNNIIALFEKTLPLPESALISGITLGTKEGITQEFFSSLKNSGTLHVVVASGMNVTLLSRMILDVFLIFFKRRFGIPMALAGIWLYVLLIGLDAPITRAAIMGSLAFIAQETGRVYLSWWGLFLAALAMLLFSPVWITDVGFLLSFAATASIIGFYSPIEKFISVKVRTNPNLNFLKKDFATSFSAQIGVTPILFVAFGQFAPWSPIVNGLVLWTVAPIMILGFLGGLLGLLAEPLGQVLILLAYPLAWFFTAIVSFF